MPADRYYRRGHWVNKPKPKPSAVTFGGWAGAAATVVLVWAVVSSCTGNGDRPTTHHPATPASVPTRTELPRIVIP